MKKSKSSQNAKNSVKKRYKILVSNDDGINSEGIQSLARALKKLGDVCVVAPEREQSTMGHALTLHKPVRLFHVASEPGLDQWALSGTPADCVCMGIRYVLKQKPDLIVSGINRGVNLGNDIYYSGTVAAAREAAVLNIPAMATSLDYHHEPDRKDQGHFDEAADYVVGLARQVLERGIPEHSLLNVNFPNRPFSQLKGAAVSRQGFRFYTDKVEKKVDTRGKPYFWLGGTYAGFRQIDGSDCDVMDQGYISITPVRLDITQYEFMQDLASWSLSPNKKAKKAPKKAKK